MNGSLTVEKVRELIQQIDELTDCYWADREKQYFCVAPHNTPPDVLECIKRLKNVVIHPNTAVSIEDDNNLYFMLRASEIDPEEALKMLGGEPTNRAERRKEARETRKTIRLDKKKKQ